VSVGSTRIDHVAQQLAIEAILNLPDVTNCPSRPDIGDVLTPKIIETVGSSTRDDRHRRRILRIGDRLANRDVLDPGETNDVAGCRVVDVDALEAFEREELGDLGLLHRPSSLHTATGSPIFTRPLKMRPMAIAPR
jgi:hypothetical protein